MSKIKKQALRAPKRFLKTQKDVESLIEQVKATNEELEKNPSIIEGVIRQTTENPIKVEPEAKTSKGKEQALVRCMGVFDPHSSLFSIRIDDGTYNGSVIGLRLSKKDPLPELPTETKNESDVPELVVAWQDYINKQNEGIKRYYNKSK